jgi:hypothetical protein
MAQQRSQKVAINQCEFSDMQRRQIGPDWRWQVAQRLVNEPENRKLHRLADLKVRETARKLRQATGKDPLLLQVLALATDLEATSVVKVLVLGLVERAEIAERLALSETIIESYEDLFFDVRPLHGASSWITAKVIRPLEQDQQDLAIRFAAAYWGGPVVATALLDAEDRVPLDEAQRLLDQETLVHIKLRRALAAPLKTAKDNLRLVGLHLQHEQRKARLKAAQERFRIKTEAELKRLELAAARLEQRRQRQERRQAAQEQRLARKADREAQRGREMHDWLDRRIEALEQAAFEPSPLATLSWGRPSLRIRAA